GSHAATGDGEVNVLAHRRCVREVETEPSGGDLRERFRIRVDKNGHETSTSKIAARAAAYASSGSSRRRSSMRHSARPRMGRATCWSTCPGMEIDSVVDPSG